MPRVLMVAYGNPLRSDDGVAWRAAESLRGKFSGVDVGIVTLHQLTPELAEFISHAECVIFVDAAANSNRPGSIDVAELHPTERESALAHALTPTAVLRLAEKLYLARPRAFCITAAGENFGHGDSLSQQVEAALPDLIFEIERVIKEFLTAR